MAYLKSSLVSVPGNQDLGGFLDTLKGGFSGALDFFGAGLKAQGGQEALQAQLAAQQAQQAQQQSGPSTTMLAVGGVALVGLLVFMSRRK